MNCHRFQTLLFEHLEGSLSPGKHIAAERHLAVCSACRELARRYREWGGALAEGLRRATEGMAFETEAQRRMIHALQQELPAKVDGESLLSHWLQRVAWAGAALVVLVVVLLFLKGVSSPDGPSASSSAHSAFSRPPIVIRSSYCAPVYTFRREDDFVVDSLGCNPLILEQTLWLARKHTPGATKSGIESRL